jgi:flagellar FliJ protein
VTRQPFKFRLERVRALRESVEDQAKEDLAASLSVRMKGEAMLEAASESYAQAKATRRGATGGPASGDQLVAAQAYLERTEQERLAAELELGRREAEVDARRTALQSAARERQVLERLKDRRKADHVRELDRREGVLLDEMAIVGHRRRERAL